MYVMKDTHLKYANNVQINNKMVNSINKNRNCLRWFIKDTIQMLIHSGKCLLSVFLRGI